MLLSRYLPGLATAGLASLGAGAVHAAAVGIHAEHRDLARIFVVVAALQMGAGIWGLVRPGRAVAWSIVAINAGAVAGWIATRTVGISWIAGLETSESPQFADTTCALMGALAAGAGLFAARVGRQGTRRVRLLLPSLAAIALTIPAMASAGTHVHSHGTAATPSNPAAHSHATAVPARRVMNSRRFN